MPKNKKKSPKAAKQAGTEFPKLVDRLVALASRGLCRKQRAAVG